MLTLIFCATRRFFYDVPLYQFVLFLFALLLTIGVNLYIQIMLFGHNYEHHGIRSFPHILQL